MKEKKGFKTKTFGIILENYFRIHMFASFAIVFSLLLLIVASIYCFTHPERLLVPDSPQIMAFILAVYFIAPVAGYHMRRVVMSNAGALFPHYRQKHLHVLFFIMAAFSLGPVLALSINGFPPLQALALFTSMPVLLIYGSLLFGESGPVMIGTLWLTKLFWDMMGIPSNLVLIPSLGDIRIFGTSWLLPLLVAILSMLLFYRYCLFFLKVPGFKLPIRYRDATNTYTNNYDRANWLTAKMTPWSMDRLLKGVKNRNKNSIISSARLMQPALFSPTTAFISQSIMFSLTSIVTIGAWLYLYLNLAYFNKPLPYSGDGIFLILIYHLNGGFASLDFLQHRHRLPMLWMQSGASNRRDFARTTAFTYFLVLGRQTLIFSLMALALPIFIKEITFMQMLAIVAAGCVWVMLLAAVTLRWSNNPNSVDSREFMIGIMMMGAFGLIIFLSIIAKSFDSTPAVWYSILVAALFAVLQIMLSYRKWREFSIDYRGPELFSPGIH